MIPNVISAIYDKSSFENKNISKPIIVIEQIGRYGCMAFMVFNIPYTYFGFWFNYALTVYLAVGGFLLLLYCLGWLILFKSRSKLKMLWLSITPAILFVFCGIVVSSIPLLLFSVLFAIGHITISYKNAE